MSIPADAHARLTEKIEELGDELGVYLLLCMTVLSNTAPDACLFIMDRVDERLAEADAMLAGGAQ